MQRVRVAEVDLVLTDRNLVVGRLEVEAHRRERVLDVAARVLAEIERTHVEVAADVVGIDRRRRRPCPYGRGRTRPPGPHCMSKPSALASREHLLQLDAWIACERRAVRIGDVADDARDLAGLASRHGSTVNVLGSGWKYMSDCSMRL